MNERPIILFPSPEKADRETKTPFFSKTKKPTFGTQYDRLQPTFSVLQSAFEQKKLKIQNSPVGINPDFVLVFEIIGTVASFYTAVKHCDGLEWMFDKDSDGFDPDDDFYEVDETGNKTDDRLAGKLYCIMSNQQAMNQLLSLWERHKNGEEKVFQRGLSGFKNVFTNIKNIRRWSAKDRIAETYAVEYWRESLEIDGLQTVPFEIELFYRNQEEKRKNSTQIITYEVNRLGGKVMQECVIQAISYHSLLVELPRRSIEGLVNDYESIALTQVDDIMFFRPTCQSVFTADADTEALNTVVKTVSNKSDMPFVAVLDGMPLQNHALLKDKVIIDDPENFANGYESQYRIHGTAMTSLVIYGDLNKNDEPINSPVYVRPILKPKQITPDSYCEFVPEDKLFVDVIHTAVIRIVRGNKKNPAVAPTIKVINLSVGDPVRQLGTTMSPLARLLDYLSYEYKILFIISAGNHPEIIKQVSLTFSEVKAASISERNAIFLAKVKENQRNMKVLSPAESINSLTVGALYDDFCETSESDHFIYAVEQGMPSPASSFGKGYRSMITPDLFYYGGRKFVRGDFRNNIDWALSNREPGCKVAAPYGTGSSFGQAYSFGTSDAAAQLTHEAVKCYDTLSQIFLSETGLGVPDDYKAMLIKAMLTHGASWQNVSEQVALAFDEPEKQLSKWLGNGIPNIERVQECTKERITLIGMGALKKDEGDVFRLPLPIDFSSKLIKRKLTVTLAYFTPISPDRQLYRSAQLWFNIVDKKGLVPERQNTEWRAVRKGTLQHEIFVGENTVVWIDDDLIIKVNCKEEAEKLKTAIPYCIFVSFEMAEGMDIDLYTDVSTKIRQRIPIKNL